MTILECNNVTKKFGGLTALEELTFSVNEGEIVGLIGPNGAGKTTLFNIIAGLFKPTTGEIRFRNEIISNLPPYKICKKGSALTFQIPQPFNGLSVLENIKIGLFFGNRHKNIKKDPMEILEIAGLIDRKDALVENLTISEQKRVELAKSLSTMPNLLLLDEVAAGLNPAEQDDLANLVKNICEKMRITVIMVEHIMRTVMSLSNRVIVLDRGRLLADDKPQAIGQNRQVIEAYLGEEYVKHTHS